MITQWVIWKHERLGCPTQRRTREKRECPGCNKRLSHAAVFYHEKYGCRGVKQKKQECPGCHKMITPWFILQHERFWCPTPRSKGKKKRRECPTCHKNVWNGTFTCMKRKDVRQTRRSVQDVIRWLAVGPFVDIKQPVDQHSKERLYSF